MHNKQYIQGFIRPCSTVSEKIVKNNSTKKAKKLIQKDNNKNDNVKKIAFFCISIFLLPKQDRKNAETKGTIEVTKPQ